MNDPRIQLDLPHRVRFTDQAFDPANPLLARMMQVTNEHPRKALVVVDRGLAQAWPDLSSRIEAYFEAYQPTLPQLMGMKIVPGGEESKNDLGFLEGLLGDVHRTGLCRKSFLLAIGGGAVLDMAGFVAAVSHRGLRCIRLPTTTLSQADAGIGVKNGLNMFGKKNFLGTFQVPWAVINDAAWLSTLPDRHWRAGLSEAVKVALLKDRAFFDALCEQAHALAGRDQALARNVWQRCATLHVDHIVRGGDPFEDRQARPLDFGHWAGHKLEQITQFEVRHGEAVAIGLAIDVTYARMIGLLDGQTAERILHTLRTLGFDLQHRALAEPEPVLEGLEEFREHLGGELTITLIRDIGQPVDVHQINRPVMRQALVEHAATARSVHP